MTPDPAAARHRAAILRDEAAALPEPARGLLMRRAEFLEKFADEVERLTAGKRSVNVHTDVTSTQLARRGRAIAASKANNPLKLAITQDSRWGSLRVYAKKRLKISPGSLTAYMQDRPCPAAVDRKIREDFPALLWNWPKGLTD